jgi:hypothetical protein
MPCPRLDLKEYSEGFRVWHAMARDLEQRTKRECGDSQKDQRDLPAPNRLLEFLPAIPLVLVDLCLLAAWLILGYADPSVTGQPMLAIASVITFVPRSAD